MEKEKLFFVKKKKLTFSPINANVSCLQRFPVMVWKLKDQDIKNMWCTRHHVFQSTLMKSYLLASLMRAMAMRILFRRKMSSRMMMTSTMARIITKTSQRVWAHRNQKTESRWRFLVAHWRPAMFVWCAGRRWSLSGGPAPAESR